MPKIIEYDHVLSRMAAMAMRCQYYNSGAFGFDRGVSVKFTGWIGTQDPTIRPEARAHTQPIPPPFEENLARFATRAWIDLFPGPAWLMPKSQWAYELDFGSKAWLPDALRRAHVDPAALEGRTNSPAIEFAEDEAGLLTPLTQALLENLIGSDFALAFPNHPIACTVHHHKQLWWLSDSAPLVERLEALRNKAVE